ncbi:serine/threonine/tyrosine-interacting protein B-like [Cimex lectularius]|uniref:Serine/threonine/tyrosine-interacting protein n=1 Tax=Cimex lectularius TaxID=79782 RepID=A0A8I6RW27_CIMLE|nr:serine/threonine/tyrosine-interacting protein B-like [Cimex lectularius]
MNGDAVPSYPKVEYLYSHEEWKYSMRRTMQEIVPGLFLGPYSSAMRSKLEELKSSGIKGIVCVRHSLEAQFIRPNFLDHFRYLILDIADSTSENIIQHFVTVRDFINEILESGGKVLVHGNAGISRSAALVLAYVMEKYGLEFKKAYDLVQQRRFCINPNVGFMFQLEEYEPIYKARLLQCSQSPSKIINKRTCDEIEED